MHIKDLFSLEGQCAVVVGGAGKVGLPMVEALAEAGAIVYIASRSDANYIKAIEKLSLTGLNVKGIKMDQSKETDVVNTLEYILKDFKTPDILINCGCLRPMTKYYHDSTENWDKSMEVNSRGLFITCRVFGNAMAARGNGSIINISSIYGMVAPNMKIYDGVDFETEPDYPFLNGGTITYSKYLASYYAKNNVRVNCISPGGIFNDQEESFLSNYKNNTLLGRMANPSDMKGIALFLASEASAYVTGTNIPIDGGWTAI